MDRSLGHVQVRYNGTSEVRPVGSVLFQPLKCKQAVWKRCKNCKFLLMLLMRHELTFAPVSVRFAISKLSLFRNCFLCERSHNDDAQDESAGRGWWVSVSEDPDVCFWKWILEHFPAVRRLMWIAVVLQQGEQNIMFALQECYKG